MPEELRRATLADVPLLLTSSELFDGTASQAALSEFLRTPRHHMVIAVDIAKAACVGFASAMVHRRPDKPAECYIDDLGIVDAYRRRGLATGLLALLESIAREDGCDAIWVLSDQTDEALAFYTTMGWEREGTHVAMFTKALT